MSNQFHCLQQMLHVSGIRFQKMKLVTEKDKNEAFNRDY